MPVLAVLSLCAAIANVVTFARMGLNQGINQSLLILSASDLILAALLVVGSCSGALLLLDRDGHLVFKMLWIVQWLISYPNTSSIAVTTIIAIVRCLYVARPLSFRRILTDRRQLAIMVFCSCISFSVLLYGQLNFSILQNSFVVQNDAWAILDGFRNTVFYVSLIINTVSMVFLIVALKKSTRFQSKATPSKANPSNSSIKREAQVIIFLLLVIFVLCNLPMLMVLLFRLTWYNFHSIDFYHMRGFINMLSGVSLPLNIGLNTFVYLAYNSRYRSTFLKPFLYFPSGSSK